MILKWAAGATGASRTTDAMLGSTLRSPSGRRGWPLSGLWRPGGFSFFLLLLLEGAGCLANPGGPPGVYYGNKPLVNIYMSVEEVKKLLGKACESVCFYHSFIKNLVYVLKSQSGHGDRILLKIILRLNGSILGHWKLPRDTDQCHYYTFSAVKLSDMNSTAQRCICLSQRPGSHMSQRAGA